MLLFFSVVSAVLKFLMFKSLELLIAVIVRGLTDTESACVFGMVECEIVPICLTDDILFL